MPTMNRALRLLASAALLALAVPPDGARAEEPAVLLSRTGELRVAAGGGVHASPLADGARFHAVAPLGTDRWIAAGVRSSSALLLVRGEGSAAERIAVPETGGRVVAAPVPVTRDGEIVGLAWLAGDDPRRLAVRFAHWRGGGPQGSWSAPERVAPPARGSQLALSGATLADGSTLLVWSAFDGRDDEILWSRYDGRRWSAPARIGADNRVPDITPTITPLGDGAVVVWSRFADGGYHLASARWLGGGRGWSEVERLTASGSVRPSLRSDGEGAVLLYRDVVRTGHAAMRLDGAARVTARAFLADPAQGAAGEDEAVVVGSDRSAVRILPAGRAEAVAVPWQPEP